jgi:putative ABC transport system permease protein
MRRFRNLVWLSLRDYFNEWQMSGCFVLALAAVLGPMLILFGLKSGIIGNMLDQLINNPRNLEIQTVGSGRFDKPWIEALRLRPEVGFVVPKTRSLSASMDLKSETSPDIVAVELISSGQGDLLLGELGEEMDALQDVVLSASAADKLHVRRGDTIDASVVRKFRGKRQREHLDLNVVGVAPGTASKREAAFVTLALAEAIESFKDGIAVAALEWEGDRPATDEKRLYSGFRLYARSLDDVTRLSQYMGDLGLKVRTRSEDIEIVQGMDRNLTMIFWVVALIGLIGFSVSLGASLWANVDRKRRDLSMMRLVGFHTGDIVWYPVIQSILTALLGWALAVGIYFGVAKIINQLMASELQPGQEVCELLPLHFALALLLTLTASIIAAAMAGYRASRIEPADGLREI